MTTTTIKPQLPDHQIQEAASAAGGGELYLDDLDFVETPQVPVSATEPLSLPAALVDDKLLEEINAIPDKMGFKIGDVAELLDVKQYVLRYWESEFEILRPKKASNNQRMYTRKDVENAFLIRKLLYRDRFSIEGARQVLRDMKQFVRREKDISQVVQKLGSTSERLHELAAQVRQLRQMFR
ncbi:MAG: MerR family transcriptional regulator [Bdellovibrionaceae bacterium]|nr:MerR family transcriptional regulator [Pseudobdellovibrionaceae bacterium]MBX3033539.1 MerR family transcriptional regulator [Pseudobdellovibrionaceae bacterium]